MLDDNVLLLAAKLGVRSCLLIGLQLFGWLLERVRHFRTGR